MNNDPLILEIYFARLNKICGYNIRQYIYGHFLPGT